MERHKFRKETIVLLIMLIVTSISRAQSVDDTQQWNVLFTHVSTERQFTVIFSSSNDSIMYEGVRYKVLMAEEDDYCFNYGLLREEAGKLFFRKHDNPPMFEDEVLIYDWTLSEGDTVFVQRGNEANGLVLSLICDTIVNGSQKREYILSYMINPDIKEKWIEGMGSELGFPFSGTKIQPESYLGLAATSELLCYHEEGELVWQNPNYDTCLINFWGIHDNTETSGLQVYPNPATTWAVVNYTLPSKISKASLVITNTLGITVMSTELNGDQGQKVLDMRDLADGVYYVRIADGENHIKTLKLVKQR